MITVVITVHDASEKVGLTKSRSVERCETAPGSSATRKMDRVAVASSASKSIVECARRLNLEIRFYVANALATQTFTLFQSRSLRCPMTVSAVHGQDIGTKVRFRSEPPYLPILDGAVRRG